MSKKTRDLTAEEKTLWRRVAASVKPRRPQPEPKDDEAPLASRSAPRPSPKPHHRPKPHAPKSPPAPPADRSAEKRVRRGKLEIGASLDLHGHHQDSGRAAVIRFLHGAHARGERTVIIITGAGRSGQGVLKQRLPEWLAAADLKLIVSGYAPAHRMHGGGGAFYVFLKRRTRE